MKKILKLVTVLSISTPVHATSQEVMMDMIHYIETNSTYTYNDEHLPSIQIRTVEELCKSVYPTNAFVGDCSVVGYYDESLNAIFIADESGPYMVSEHFIETVLFHELVHFLQYVNGAYDTVECKKALEKDAYLLQDQYVQDMEYPEEQRPDLLFALVSSVCEFENYAPVELE